MASWYQHLDYVVYFCLLFFVIPIKYNGPTELEIKFESYLKKYNKSYDDPLLYQRKLEAFKRSLEEIETFNSQQSTDGGGSAKYGLTKFSDMLPEEFLEAHLQPDLGQRISKRANRKGANHPRRRRSVMVQTPIQDLPKSVDWRRKNVVTAVRDQGYCGACWAFSTVQTIESMYAIKTGRLRSLSVQEMIDCAENDNEGCDGGDICDLLEWLTDNNVAVRTEKEYPLVLTDDRCKVNVTKNDTEVPDGSVFVKEFACENLAGMEDLMLHLLATNGPLAVGINALTWQNYIGGVIHYHCGASSRYLNHAVQIVGYDLNAPVPYYIVRNSWGEDFGDKGYVYVAAGQNMCGIAKDVNALTVL